MGRNLWGNTIERAMSEAGLTPAKEEAMKVRRKVNPYRDWLVKEESPSFYIACDGDSDAMALSKHDYEPVQEWVRKYYVPFPLENVRMKAEGSITVIEVKK